MFEEVEARMAAFLPLSAENLRRLDLVFEPLFIYGSNAIEGNTLSLGDTIYLIREGRLPGGKREEEYLEVKGQQKAYAYLRQAVQAEFTLSEKLIREFHQLLTEPLDFEKYRPGQYKGRENQVLLADGSVFPYVSHVDTPAAMQELVAWFNGPGLALHAVERAAQLHYKFILIHPFRDGNGRSARLLANFALLRAGHVLTVFRADERRPDYLRALHAVDVSIPRQELAPGHPGLNFFPFVSHVEQELLWSYDRTLDVLEGKVPLETADLVRRFESVERQMRDAMGIPADERARLAAAATSVVSLVARINGLASDLATSLNQSWQDLSMKVTTSLKGQGELLFELKSRNIVLPAKQPRGQAGLVSVSIRQSPSSLIALKIPRNGLEFVISTEPHRLSVATFDRFRGGNGVVGELHLSTVESEWSTHEIERFALAELNAFLETTPVKITELNRQGGEPSPGG